MKIAIASGKGGTGKTTIATNLAYVAARNGRTVAYLDCDVEEPNGHIFLKPTIAEERPITKLIPVVDAARCTHCGKCSRICRYGAIACVGKQTLVFPELCHACGGCMLVCPEDAIQEVAQPVGQLRLGTSGRVQFIEGVLDVGEAMSPPAIRVVKEAAPDTDLILLDSPPGTSCPAAIEMVKALKLPFAVVVNRADAGDEWFRNYCEQNRVSMLAEIPDDRAVAEAYSRGDMICEAVPAFDQCIRNLLDALERKIPGNHHTKETR